MFDQSIWCCICDADTTKAIVYERLVILNSDEVFCGIEEPVFQPVVGYLYSCDCCGCETSNNGLYELGITEIRLARQKYRWEKDNENS
jgi:hypothetical protein